MKQTTKALRPPTLLDRMGKQDDSIRPDKLTKNQPAPAISHQDDHKNNTRETICTHLLETGNVQSFIDLFYISHKCLPNVMESKNYFGETVHLPE
jgi:glycerol kinase